MKIKIENKEFYSCPNCGNSILKVIYKYCPNCGQKIEWYEELKFPERIEDLKNIKGYYIYNGIIHLKNEEGIFYKKSIPKYNILCVTEGQAKKAYIIPILTQLMAAYNDGWEADWNDNSQLKFVLYRDNKYIFKSHTYCRYQFIAFKTPELRDKFFLHFEKECKIFWEMDI